MLRSIVEEVLLFVLPFCAFAGYLVLKKRNPLDVEHWSPHLFALSATGLALAAAFFAWAAWTAPRHAGTYVPPHMENGRLVPGQFK